MDPVEIQTSVILSRVAIADIPFDRAVERAGSNSEVVVFGGALLIDNMGSAWAPESDVTITTPAGINGNCNKMAIAAGFTTGLIATKDVTTLDLSSYAALGFLIKASIDVAAGVLQIGWDEGATDMSGSPVYLDLPALTAGEWYWISLAYSGVAGDRNAVLSIGLNATADPLTVDLYVDEVRTGELFYGIVGLANDDEAKENDKAEQYEDVAVLARGHMLGDLIAGQSCVAQQPLYPVPGTGELTAEKINMDGASIEASEDATSGSRVGVII